jgi:Transposase DDE domain
MPYPLYAETRQTLCQWVDAADKRHLDRIAEMVSACLLSGSCRLPDWVPHAVAGRSERARAAEERWAYALHNERIQVADIYSPLIRDAIRHFEGETVFLCLDTSVLWNRLCLVSVGIRAGGRCIPLCWKLLEHASASVGFSVYQPLLEQARSLLPPQCRPFLLADRGFDHLQLIAYLQDEGWGFNIRVKGNRCFWSKQGRRTSIAQLTPGTGEGRLVSGLALDRQQQRRCNLVVGIPRGGRERWAVLTSEPPTLAVIEQYGWRFQIEGFFRDLKSGQFELAATGFKDVAAIDRLLMVLNLATLWAVQQGQAVCRHNLRQQVDGHTRRGMTYLRLGLQWLQKVLSQGRKLLPNRPLDPKRQASAQGSQRQALRRANRSQFDRLTTLSYA